MQIWQFHMCLTVCTESKYCTKLTIEKNTVERFKTVLIKMQLNMYKNWP